MKSFTLSKKIALVLAVLTLGSLLGATLAFASGKFDETQEAEKKVEEWVTQQEAQKGNESGYTEAEGEYRTFYELSYARATTDEQRAQLKAIFADHSIGSIGEWIRPVLITLGDLPTDTPRLTAQDAANLYGKVDFADMEEEFNKIAGAPDWKGGSGIYRSIYYLNDERTEAIYLMLNDVHHVIFNKDGTQTILPVGTQKLPGPVPTVPPKKNEMILPEPTPTEAPNINNANVQQGLGQ